MRQHRVFGCPAIFKRYEISDSGKRIKNKYVQQGIRAIFVGFPDDSSGWLFYVPSTKRTYILSMDAIFDENFTSPLSMPDLPFRGALKLRGINTPSLNTDTITEVTGPPIGEDDTFPSDLISSHITRSQSSAEQHNSLICQEEYQHISEHN